jgi:hypothetical protein
VTELLGAVTEIAVPVTELLGAVTEIVVPATELLGAVTELVVLVTASLFAVTAPRTRRSASSHTVVMTAELGRWRAVGPTG